MDWIKKRAAVFDKDFPLWVITALALAMVGLNGFDALVTYFGVRCGHIQEANPIMNFLLDIGGWAFLSVKLLGVTGLVFLVWQQTYRHRYLYGLYGLILAASVYCLIFLLHCDWLLQL